MFRPAHGAIFGALLALFDRGDPVDALTVAHELGPALVAAGGAPYLAQLMASTPSPRSVAYYADMVLAAATSRRLLAAGEHIAQLARSDAPAADKLADADLALRLASATGGRDSTRRLGDWLDQVVDDLQNPAGGTDGIPTGYLDLDLELRPLLPGQFIVIGARPAVGKSIVGLDLVRHCALRLRRPAGLISLEMTGAELTQRAIAAEAGVPLTDLLRRDLSEDAWERIAKASDRIREAPLWIEDLESQTLHSIRAWVRRHKVDLLVVDYLQLVTAQTTDARYRQNAVAELARGLKLLAKSERIPVVVLAQLNRQPEGRSGGRPNLADLRESGAIEQDADVVLLLHRPELYDPLNRAGEVDLIVAKQRQGPTTTVTLMAQTAYSRFVDGRRSW
jgi:replicative DNA helicase